MMSWTDVIYEDGADRGVGAQRHTESMLALRERVIALQGASAWYLEDEKLGYRFGLNRFLDHLDQMALVSIKSKISSLIGSDWVDMSLADEFGSFDAYFAGQPEGTLFPLLTPERVLEVAELPADWFYHDPVTKRYLYGARDSEYGWQSVPLVLNQLMAIASGMLTWTGERKSGGAYYEEGVLETPEEIRDAAIADYEAFTPIAYSQSFLEFRAGWDLFGTRAFLNGDKGSVTVTNPSDDSEYAANHKGEVSAKVDIYRRRIVRVSHDPTFNDGHGTGVEQKDKMERWHTDIALLAGASVDRAMDALPPVFPVVPDPMPENYWETHRVYAKAIYKFDFDYKGGE